MTGLSGDAARWLPEARAGSQRALGQVLEACRKYLLWIARRELDPTLQGKGRCSDLVQNTFLEAVQDFDRFQGDTETELLAWLRRLLLHNLADFKRHYCQTSKRQIAREVPLELVTGSADRRGAVCAGGSSPLDEVAAHEQAGMFKVALERLPDNYRRVITLWYQEEKTFEEIGDR